MIKRSFFSLNEGDINLYVAQKVAATLKDLPLKVSLIRKAADPVRKRKVTLTELDTLPAEIMDLSSFRAQLEWLIVQENTQELFQKFISFELETRRKVISKLKPDLLLSIHFNANQDNEWTNHNGVMVFIPGCFLKKELETPKMRQLAFNLILKQDYSRIIHLAKLFVDILKEVFNLPYVNNHMFAQNLVNNWQEIIPGVFARNLRILQNPTIVSLLLEGPFMNNRKEHKLLQDGLCDPLKNWRLDSYVSAITKVVRVITNNYRD